MQTQHFTWRHRRRALTKQGMPAAFSHRQSGRLAGPFFIWRSSTAISFGGWGCPEPRLETSRQAQQQQQLSDSFPRKGSSESSSQSGRRIMQAGFFLAHVGARDSPGQRSGKCQDDVTDNRPLLLQERVKVLRAEILEHECYHQSTRAQGASRSGSAGERADRLGSGATQRRKLGTSRHHASISCCKRPVLNHNDVLAGTAFRRKPLAFGQGPPPLPSIGRAAEGLPATSCQMAKSKLLDMAWTGRQCLRFGGLRRTLLRMAQCQILRLVLLRPHVRFVHCHKAWLLANTIRILAL